MPDRKLVLRIEGLALSALVTWVLLGSTPAQADVDYEDQSLGPVAPAAVLTFDGPLSIKSALATEISDGVACVPNCPYNGTQYHKSDFSGVPGTFAVEGSLAGNGCDPACIPFDLLAIDVAESSPSSGPITVGFLASNGAEFTFVTDGVADGPGGAPDFEWSRSPGISATSIVSSSSRTRPTPASRSTT
jgi:hypothetical protein